MTQCFHGSLQRQSPFRKPSTCQKDILQCQYVYDWCKKHHFKGEIILNTGLYKLCHPSILDGRTWSKLGEHGEYQPGDQKHSIHESKQPGDSKPGDSKHSTDGRTDGRSKNHNMRTWRSWSWVSSRWENFKRNVEPCLHKTSIIVCHEDFLPFSLPRRKVKPITLVPNLSMYDDF